MFSSSPNDSLTFGHWPQYFLHSACSPQYSFAQRSVIALARSLYAVRSASSQSIPERSRGVPENGYICKSRNGMVFISIVPQGICPLHGFFISSIIKSSPIRGSLRYFAISKNSFLFSRWTSSVTSTFVPPWLRPIFVPTIIFSPNSSRASFKNLLSCRT